VVLAVQQPECGGGRASGGAVPQGGQVLFHTPPQVAALGRTPLACVSKAVSQKGNDFVDVTPLSAPERVGTRSRRSLRRHDHRRPPALLHASFWVEEFRQPKSLVLIAGVLTQDGSVLDHGET